MLYIGPHVSIASSIAFAPTRAKSFGATGFAIFTKNQRIWSAPPLAEEAISGFKAAMEENGYISKAVLPHAGYLINPATPDKELWVKSKALFEDESDRVLALGLSCINIHPGAFREGKKEDGFKRSAKMLDAVLETRPTLSIAIENTAGAGTILGSTFEELDAIISASRFSERLGITIDTAHLYGAGYDVKNDISSILASFFSRFGKEKLYGMHLNDSKASLSSHKDRHESIGKGLIGKDAFLEIVKMKEVQDIPLILETPDETAWSEEIRLLLG